MGTGSTVARNTVFNVFTQLGVGVLALFALPILVRGIGEDSFGLLSTVWMVVGYFSILDLGLSQASVKFLARHLELGENEEANATIVTSLYGTAVLGSLAGIGIVAATPLLTGDVLRLSPEQVASAQSGLRLVALAVPFVMVQASLRAVAMAAQRFDLVNGLQLLSGALQWGGALILVLLQFGLQEIIILTVAIRILTTAIAYQIAVHVFPGLRWVRVRDLRKTGAKMLRFGGWMSVTQILNPIVGYLDRIFIATYLSMKAMAYYSVPFEALSRLQVIPLSLSLALFPAIASKGADDPASRASVRDLYAKSMKAIIVVIVPISIVLAVFSREILAVWLGDGDIVSQSSPVFTLLAIAVSAQAIAYVPVTALQAAGRPEIATKLYLAEAPFYLTLCYLLIPVYGIQGAASAWLIRLVVIATAFHFVSTRTLRAGETRITIAEFWRVVGCNLFFLAACIVARLLPVPWFVHGLIVGLSFLVYGACVWAYCTDERDRQVLVRLLPGRKHGCLNG